MYIRLRAEMGGWLGGSSPTTSQALARFCLPLARAAALPPDLRRLPAGLQSSSASLSASLSLSLMPSKSLPSRKSSSSCRQGSGRRAARQAGGHAAVTVVVLVAADAAL
jgi:hypothetical protein